MRERMTTTEKRGFRLPWGAGNGKPEDDASTGASPTSATARAILAPAEDLAPAIAPDAATSARAGATLRRGQVDDLGVGPFGLAPGSDDEDDVSAASADAIVELPDGPAAKPAAVAAEPDAAEPETGADTAAPMSWPEMDRRGSATHLASDAPPPPRPPVVVEGAQAARKSNPLVAGLVKAMRDAARTARDETTNRMRADAAARVDEIRSESAAAAVALRKQADEDIAAIREWSRTEAARIKTETETKITARKTELAGQAQAHATQTEHSMGEVKGAIAAFEAEMERFFDILLAEDDPARLATLAERLPEPPSFARPQGTGAAPRPRAAKASAAPRRKATAGPTRPSARLAPDAAAAAEAEAIAGLDDEPASFVAALDRLDDAPSDAPAAEDFTGDAEGATNETTAEAVASPTMEQVEADPELAPDWTEPEAVAPDAGEHDTNGHVAVGLDAPEAPDALVDWSTALAAINADSRELNGTGTATAVAENTAAGVVTAETDPLLDELDLPSPTSALAAMMADAPRIDSPDDLTPEERIALLGFDEVPVEDEPEGTASADAEPVENVTRVVASGLTSVGGISTFKSALAAVEGVVSVSVTTGHDGAFVFSIVHATATDLRAAVAGFSAFGAELTADEGAVLTYSVTEPAT
jgi:hypothetical protein